MLDVRCQMLEAKSGQVTLGYRYCTGLAWHDLQPFRNRYAARRRLNTQLEPDVIKNERRKAESQQS
jgi:hypothetical protein